MTTLIIYDNSGYIIQQISGYSYRKPLGVPHLEVEIPEGKRATSVDITKQVHSVIFEDMPPTEIELLNKRIKQQEDALFELADLLAEVHG